MNEFDKKQYRLNQVFFLLTLLIFFGLFLFNHFALPLILVECFLFMIRYFLSAAIESQRTAPTRAAEIQRAINMKAVEAKKVLVENERSRITANERSRITANERSRITANERSRITAIQTFQQKVRQAEQKKAEQKKKFVEKKPVATQSLNFDKSNDAQNTSRSIEQISSQEQQCTNCFLFVRNGLTVCPVENPACPHFDKSNDAQNTPTSIEQISNDLVSSIPCASDIVKAQSVSFSPRAPGNVFGLAEEMSKVGYRSVGDFYSDIQKIVTHEIEIATVVKKFDLITNNEYLRGTLTRLLYAAALGTAKPKDSDLKPLASALRTIVESQKIVPRALGGPSSLEMAELLGAIVVTAVSRCQFGSASALVEHFKIATLSFADETISPDGPSNRRYVTALVLCFLTMAIETSKSISIVTDSLAGNRLVPIDINQLGSIDFDYLNANRPGWLAEVIAKSPELQRAYLRHLRDDK